MNSYRHLIFKIIISTFIFINTSTFAQNPDDKDWTKVFNGHDIKNWTVKVHHYEAGDNYANTFRVEDNMIRVSYDEYEGQFNDRFAHLYYNESYSYFRLQLEYRFVGELYPGAPSYTLLNSGVMFHSQNPHTMPKEQDWPISVEMQFLAGVEEGKARPTGNMCSPGTDIVFDGQIYPEHCLTSSSPTIYGDEWVKAELIVLGDSLVYHLINGDTVLQYTQPQVGGGVVSRYDPQFKPDGKLLNEGYIALQSEGQPIDFQNIRILDLEGCMDPNALNYKEYYIKSRPLDCQYPDKNE